MEAKSFGFIGSGRITRLLLHALKQKNALPEKVLVADPDANMIKQVQKIDPATIASVNNNADVLNVDILFLAVHPPVMKDVAAEISGKTRENTVVVSLIPVITTDKLSTMLGGVTRLVRMIPNAPSIIHKGYNPVFYSNGISVTEKQQLQQLFGNWGEAPEVEEHKLEAYAIITAMGPTYLWPQWLKLQTLGKEFGMSHDELNKAMAAMLTGSVELMYNSDLTPETVMDLIPVYPLKQKESEILDIYDSLLKELYQKLTGASK